jgi:tRNA pseudouridine55 synthase
VLVDKPAGKTSHDVVQHVRRALRIRAAGHTGTLDPFATGLLVILVGRATRLARFIEVRPKTYVGTGRLGIRTTTDDLTGEQIGPEVPVRVSAMVLEETLAGFRGDQTQRPPQFSAKRVEGERSYRRARRGEMVELADVPVTIYDLTLLAYRPPEFEFRATVSAGTYIRAIARDLGERLSLGAHLTRLRREAIGSLSVEDAVPLDRVSLEALLPVMRVLPDVPALELDETAHQAIVHGRAVADWRGEDERSHGATVALLASGELVAMARAEEGRLHPTVVLGDQ